MRAKMLSNNTSIMTDKRKLGGTMTQNVKIDGNLDIEIDQAPQPVSKKDSVERTRLDNVFMEPDWLLASQIYDQDEAIKVKITGFNKGGLLTNWAGLPGFLPASQLENFPECHLLSIRLEALSAWVNQEVTVKIIELEKRTNRLIFSERAANVTVDARIRLLNHLRPGQRIIGEITNLAAFGVFVDLGGVEGLIHISELSWGRVVNPEDLVTPGQKLEVLVLNIDREAERIALSRKRLLRNPWEAIEERYEPGQRVRGVITNMTKYGAFAEVEEGLEGLIHISEICEQGCESPDEMLEIGEHVLARVLEVDGSNHRLALSLKLEDS